MKKFRVLCFLMIFCIVSSCSFAFAHSGGLDSNGGHHDYNNKSGLGYYHYHCWGYPPHLHPGGVCPYRGGTTSSNNSSWTSGVTAGIAATSKIQLKRPVIHTYSGDGYIKIKWDEVNHADYYKVYRSTSKYGNYTMIAMTYGTAYIDNKCIDDKRYYYKVKAFGSGRYTRSFYSKPKSNISQSKKPDIVAESYYHEVVPTEELQIFVSRKNSNKEITVRENCKWFDTELEKVNGYKNKYLLTVYVYDYEEYCGDIGVIYLSFDGMKKKDFVTGIKIELTA